MIETTTSDSMLAWLEALTTRLEAVEVLETEVADLRGEVAGLKAENARLPAALSAPTNPTASPVPPTTSRRGMLRRVLGASAAAGVLLVAREAAQPKTVMAVTAMQFANVSGDNVDNVAHGITRISSDPPFTPADSVFIGQAFGGNAICGLQGQVGTRPTPPRTCGVFGNSQPNNTVGVFGQADSGSQAIGVLGQSAAGSGVSGTGPIGVFATGTGTAAVYGVSNGTYGVWGNSGASSGLIGTSTSYIGVQALSTNHWGLHAKSPTYAGVFEGNVFVTGQVIALGGVFGVSGTSAGGSGARALTEDVGEATLVNGKATVALDKAFAEEVGGGQYHVFVTPHDASARPLAVVARRGDGFDVQELAGAGAAARPSGGTFSYRAVARRAADAGTRAAPLAPPDLTTVKPTPKPPEPARAPEPSRGSDERPRP